MRRAFAIAVVALMVLPSAPAVANDDHRRAGDGDKIRLHITKDVPLVSRNKWEDCKNLNAILNGEMETDKSKIELMQQCKMLRKR